MLCVSQTVFLPKIFPALACKQEVIIILMSLDGVIDFIGVNGFKNMEEMTLQMILFNKRIVELEKKFNMVSRFLFLFLAILMSCSDDCKWTDEDICCDQDLLNQFKAEVTANTALFNEYVFVGNAEDAKVYLSEFDSKKVLKMTSNSPTNTASLGKNCVKQNAYTTMEYKSNEQNTYSNFRFFGKYLNKQYSLSIRFNLFDMDSSFVIGGKLINGYQFASLDSQFSNIAPNIKDTLICFGQIYRNILVIHGSKMSNRNPCQLFFAKGVGLIRIAYIDTISNGTNSFVYNLNQIN